MTNLQELRKTALNQIQNISQKQRFGYFSIPPNLSMGDTQFIQKKIQKDQNGRVKTAPRNIYTHPTASGNNKSSYFNLSKSIYDGDLYKDPGKSDLQDQLKIKKKYQNKQIFKPATSIKKTLMKSSYQYIINSLQQKKNIQKDQNGRIVTSPKNITTNPTSKVITDFFKFPKYIPSSYDSKQNLKQNKQTKKIHQTPFKNVSTPLDTFNKSKAVFGNPENLHKKIQKKIYRKILYHQNPFKPSGPGKKIIAKFPQYICVSPQQVKRNKSVEQSKKQHFKLTNPNQKTMYSPSITLHKTNLFRYIY